jgi:predicted nucleic acid-binding protein
MKVFFDTNVVVDILSGRTGIIESARAVQKCPRPDRVVSALSVANCTYVMRGQGRAGVEQLVKELLREFTVVPLRRGEFVRALSLNGPDLKDALQYAMAEKAAVDVLVTRDLAGFPFAGKISVLTPAQFLAMK